jgi:predicted acylesterase/phospholipase RssA
MSKRLAITISGAVSLGSYEAGVLYEILEALRQHNTDPATTDANKIFIDVITGASAGCMTAAIAAQKLLYEGNSLSKQDANPFYMPWVVDVSLQGLLALNKTEDPTHSIFSSDLIKTISLNYLTKRYQSHIPLRPTDRNKHPAVADRLYLGMALSNLNGINYSQKLRTGGQFTYTEHQDQVSLEFLADGSDGKDNGDLWEFARSVAVASGAFPFAFRVQDIYRHQSEYPNADPFPAATELFSYSDGGIFQNEPLGMAKDFVDKIDNHQNSDSRFYLFIAPGSRDGTQDLAFRDGTKDPKNTANLWNTGQRLVSSIFEQARFHDWITAEEVNKEVHIFNERAGELHDALQNGSLTASTLQPAALVLLPKLFAGTGKNQGVEWARLRDQFKSEFDDLNRLTPPAGSAFIDILLTLETAADLGPKDEMNIYGITAANEELAGADLCAFTGFFDQRYRQHDYDVGRTKARAFLNNAAGLGALGPIHWTPQSPIQIDHDLDDLQLRDTDKNTREEIRARALDRANDILDEIGIRGFILGNVERAAILNFVVKPLIDKLLNL